MWYSRLNKVLYLKGRSTAKQVFEQQDKQKAKNSITLPGAVHPKGECTDSYGKGWCDGVQITTMDPYQEDVRNRQVEITACRGVIEGLRQDI